MSGNTGAAAGMHRDAAAGSMKGTADRIVEVIMDRVMSAWMRLLMLLRLWSGEGRYSLELWVSSHTRSRSPKTGEPMTAGNGEKQMTGN